MRSFLRPLFRCFSKPSSEEFRDSSYSLSVSIAASLACAAVMHKTKTTKNGLSSKEAAQRLRLCGSNQIASEQKPFLIKKIFGLVKDPLNILLTTLGVVSFATGDFKAGVLIITMLFLSVGLRFIQEHRADRAAEKLKAMVHTTVAVTRDGKEREILLNEVVPGDIVCLSAGDMIPADIRLLTAKDLFVDQAALTGESVPAEKRETVIRHDRGTIFELPNICFMGTHVGSGIATGIVIATGRGTYFGALARDVVSRREESTSFDKGIEKFTWLMIRFMAILVPAVFLINGMVRGNWLEAFFFGLAIAVGLTPELLPMIVSVNLSKAALDMSRKKVIVKRLNAIQDFGAMDILCTDKTGTLTLGKVTLIKHLDIEGKENEDIFHEAYLNSFYQTGLKNLLDTAVLKHDPSHATALEREYKKVDEIPFDFTRRRMTVVVAHKTGSHLLICKGAVDEMLRECTHVLMGGKRVPIAKAHHAHKDDLVDKLSREGFRLIAIAHREFPKGKQEYTAADESGMTLAGFLAFLDPPKDTATLALRELRRCGVQVKILTGDNELVTRKICREVDLEIEKSLLGHEIDAMNDAELGMAAESATVFDRLEPAHKERIIRALKSRGHVVGFLGDGINDAPALKAADVGISVDGAVDIAKESSDIILLEKSLLVLRDGVREGRRAFGNIVKYIKMAGSSNFGNMFSVVGASFFLPFLPMLPLQVIANNLLYDFS